jgi:predicted dehydrogenase
MTTIRWGIIGCGNVTEVKSGPGFQKARGSALVAVMRRNAALAEDYARRHGVPRWYADAQALIDDPEVDAVYVATPPSSHKHYTLLAAAAGKPVYVEKPMALNHGECQKMIAACQAADVPLFVAYYRRSLPRFVKIKELLDQGAIGAVRFVQIALYQPARPAELDPASLPWRVQPQIAGGGHFVDLASHTLDLLDYTLGPIGAAQGFAGNQAGLYPAEDVVTGSVVFQSGVQGVGVWCFNAYDAHDSVEIVGERGQISFSTFGVDDPVRLVTPDGDCEFYIPHPPHVQQPLIQTVVDELLGSGRCPSSGESAARTSWVMDRMLGGDLLSPDLRGVAT